MKNGFTNLETITATELNHGKSSSAIKKVHDEDCDIVVIKQSKPYAVIVSYEKYRELVDMFEQQGGRTNGNQ